MNFSIRFSYETVEFDRTRKRQTGTRVISMPSEQEARALARAQVPNLERLNHAARGTLIIDDVVALG